MSCIINTRFGEIEYDPANTLLFPFGLVGFEQLRHFVVMPNEKDGPLFWIQSVEDPMVAFVLTDPNDFFFDYKVAPGPQELENLGIDKDAEWLVVSVVTVPPDHKVTLNLAAPIFFAPTTNRAVQVILEGAGYSPRTPLPVVGASE